MSNATTVRDDLKIITSDAGSKAREFARLSNLGSNNPIIAVGGSMMRAVLELVTMFELYYERLTATESDLAVVLPAQIAYLRATMQGTVVENQHTLFHDLTQILDNAQSLMRTVLNLVDQLEEDPKESVVFEDANEIADRLRRIQQELLLSQQVESAVESAKEAAAAATASKVAAGTTADATLGSHYEKIAREELRDARNFRRLAMACFVIGIAVAIWIAWSIVNDHQEGAASQLFKLAVTIPILGAAFYLAHEANTHRMVARRAKEVEIRLQTMEAFIAPLEPEQRALLRAKVGESILSGPLNLSAGTDKQAVDAQAIIEKLIDKAN